MSIIQTVKYKRQAEVKLYFGTTFCTVFRLQKAHNLSVNTINSLLSRYHVCWVGCLEDILDSDWIVNLHESTRINYSQTRQNRGHPMQSFWLVFEIWLLFDYILMASRCIWPIKTQGLWEVELSIVEAIMALGNSASPSSRILIGQLKRKPPERFKKMSQS